MILALVADLTREDNRTKAMALVGVSIGASFMIALVEFFMRLDSSIYAPLYALFWVGPTALLIEMWLDSRRARATASVVAPGSIAAQT